MELVIMAAGMGSRFGGLKQITPMGPNGEFIIDYSIYDAIRAGFKKVVFVIKEENYNDFRETVGARIEKFINVEYAFQKMDNVPEFVNIPKDRVKPLGTAHAVYCAKDKITGPFLVINSDDFYGRDAFMVASEFLKNKSFKQYATVCYKAINTILDSGSVKRGVVKSTNGQLDLITESSISKCGDHLACKALNTGEEYDIDNDNLVSMNMLAFDPSIFGYIESKMSNFFINNADKLDTCEFFIPDLLESSKDEEFAEVFVLGTHAKWYGVTYKEDADYVKNAIKNMIDNHEYPNSLWGL